MLPHSTPNDELLAALSTDPVSGLSEQQAKELLLSHGENRLKEKKRRPWILRFLLQFWDVMILILIGAAIVSFITAAIENDSKAFLEPILILAIVILNALLGVFQESRAEKALDAIKKLSAPHARVLRGGEEKLIDSALLVPGDIILLEAGDFVPADARLLRSVSLKTDESALTGESLPAEKDALCEVPEKAALGDRVNMVFSGCAVTYGTARAVVCATGMDTEMGRIANLLADEKEAQTPLQKKLASLGKYLGIAALAACAVIFVIGLLDNIPVLDIFMTAVALAVSAIPEGLPAIVTIVLSIGVQRMVKKNAIIRRLPAVETLGSASVICSDKTGTLTQNRMTLTELWCAGEPSPEKVTPEPTKQASKLLTYAALCCDGSVVFTEDETLHIGDPTETSIVFAAHRAGFPKELLQKDYPREAELPFDSDRKLMTVVCKTDTGYLSITKGAFDMLMPRCIHGDAEAAAEIVSKMASGALRVLAVAYKELSALPADITSETLESGLSLLGVVGMIDPPREEVADAVRECTQAGIRPVMITGDHIVTACAIAEKLGILRAGDRAVTGAELDAMEDEELDRTVSDISVYARVSPENKIRIVKAWQRRGDVVAMTGDGVNDAPALKAADIGCAMGITGTDVAKSAAAMTLTDDNFTTIVHAVREGRGIYSNIRKVVGFLLGTNIGEILSVFFAMLLWKQSPFLSMQLLWINLVTDSLPAIGLGMEPVEKDVMNQKPKPKTEGIFAHGLGLRVILQGIMFGSLALLAFWFGQTLGGSIDTGRTLAFLVMGLSQIVQSVNMRSERSLFKIPFFGNKKLLFAVLASCAMLALVLFTPLASPFGLVTLSPVLYLLGLGLSLVPFLVMELSKAFGLIRHQG